MSKCPNSESILSHRTWTSSKLWHKWGKHHTLYLPTAPPRNPADRYNYRFLRWRPGQCLWPEALLFQWSGQIIIFHQPRFPWNKGISLPQLPFGVRSCEVAIIWPEWWPVQTLKFRLSFRSVIQSKRGPSALIRVTTSSNPRLSDSMKNQRIRNKARQS